MSNEASKRWPSHALVFARIYDTWTKSQLAFLFYNLRICAFSLMSPCAMPSLSRSAKGRDCSGVRRPLKAIPKQHPDYSMLFLVQLMLHPELYRAMQLHKSGLATKLSSLLESSPCGKQCKAEVADGRIADGICEHKRSRYSCDAGALGRLAI